MKLIREWGNMRLDNKTNASGSLLKGRVGPAFHHWLAPEIACVFGGFGP